jgi:hypothetical protein
MMDALHHDHLSIGIFLQMVVTNPDLENIHIQGKTKAIIIIIMSQLFQSENDDRRRCGLASY